MRRAAAPRRGLLEPATGGPPTSSPDTDAPPRVELPDGESRAPLRREPVPRFTGPPVISPPNAEIPEGNLPVSERRAAADELATPMDLPPAEEAIAVGEAPVRDEPARDERSGRRAATRPHFVARGSSEPVASLVVNPKLTVWRKSQSDTSSDGGLQVVVEPRDAEGRMTTARGDIAIAVLDPSQSGPAAQIGALGFYE